jgi:hypothetical protein
VTTETVTQKFLYSSHPVPAAFVMKDLHEFPCAFTVATDMGSCLLHDGIVLLKKDPLKKENRDALVGSSVRGSGLAEIAYQAFHSPH